MRNVIQKRIRPLVEQLAKDLADIAVRRLDADIERMREAFDVALSAYQSAEPRDLITDALGPELARMLQPQAPPRPVERLVEQPTAPADERRTADRKRLPTCSICGFAGGNKRGCGRSHPTQAQSAPVAATPARRDLIAERAKRPLSLGDATGDEPEESEELERWPAERIARERADAETHKLEGSLPPVKRSFDRTFPGGLFRELNTGDEP